MLSAVRVRMNRDGMLRHNGNGDSGSTLIGVLMPPEQSVRYMLGWLLKLFDLHQPEA